MLNLNALRNDQIPGFFYDTKNRDAVYRCELLEDLKTELPHLSDEDLERRLYGDSGEPRYSSWTMQRLAKQLSRAGLAFARLNDQEFQIRSVLEKREFSKRKAETRRELLKQRIWNWRKGLRLKAAEVPARLRAAIKPADLRQPDLRLNLGAGGEAYEGWIRVDWSGAQDVYDNIVRLEKFAASSVRAIYSNHVLEHIPPAAIQLMLKRWFEVVLPGGFVRCRAPNARACIEAVGGSWKETTEEELSRLGFPNFLERESTRGGVLDDQAAVQCVQGWSDSNPAAWDASNQHKSLWTPSLAQSRFEAAGFKVLEAGSLGTLNTYVIAQKETKS